MVRFLKVLAVFWIFLGLVFLTPIFAVISILLGELGSEPDLVNPISWGPLITLGTLSFCFMALAFINGILLFRRKGRKASLIISALMCLGFPFGTVLGLVSWFVLSRDEVKQHYLDA